MARRRQPGRSSAAGAAARAGAALGAVPSELARCVVEDWVAPDELEVLGRDGALVRASVRWRAARRRWLDEHAIPRSGWGRIIPCRRPVFAADGADG